MKILVTKSTRSLMKKMRNLLRKTPDKSARYVPSESAFPTITHLCSPLQRAPASKSSKPASKAKRSKSSSSKKQAVEPIEEDDNE